MKKIISLILCAVMLFALSAMSAVSADEPDYDEMYKKWKSGGFADDQVVIIVNNDYRGKLDTLTPEHFPGIEVAGIKYDQECNCCIELHLANRGEENVLEACKILAQNPIVKEVGPNTIGFISEVENLFANLTPGDFNSDKKINSKDVKIFMALLTAMSTGSYEYSTYVMYVLDVYRDGVFNLKDVARLMQYLAGWHEDVVYVCPGFENYYVD